MGCPFLHLSFSSIALCTFLKALTIYSFLLSVTYFFNWIVNILYITWASQVALAVKNLPANAGNASSIPGWGRSPGRGHSNPLQYSCLENPMVRGARWATVHRVTKIPTWLKWLSTHAHIAYAEWMLVEFN